MPHQGIDDSLIILTILAVKDFSLPSFISFVVGHLTEYSICFESSSMA